MAILLFVGLPNLSSPAYADGDHMKIVSKFFEVLKEQKSGPAIDYAFGTSPWAADQKPQIAQVKLQYAAIEPLVGTLHGYDVFIDEAVFDRYAYVLVLAAYEKQPVTIEFLLYRPEAKWAIQNFSFSTEFAEAVKAAAVSKLCGADNLTTP